MNREQEQVARLRAALDKPIAEDRHMQSVDEFDPWEDIVTGVIGSYNSALDRLAIDVLKAMRDRKTFDLVESDRGLAAELMLNIFATWLGEYGSSPRGLWPAYHLKPMWDELIEKWEAYAAMHWGEGWNE